MNDSANSMENSNVEKHFQCDQCSFTTEFHSDLVHHLSQVHNEQQTFLGNVSDISEDAAIDKGNNSTPVSGLDDEKRRLFHCESCSFSSPFRSKIVSHCVVHSDARPFICDLCDYAAKRKYDLKKHMHFKHKVFQSGFIPLPNQPSIDNSSLRFVTNQYGVNEHESRLTATNTNYPNESVQYSKNISSVKMESETSEDDCYIIDESLSVQDSFPNASMLNLSNVTSLNKQSVSDFQEHANRSLVSAAPQSSTASDHISVPGLTKSSSTYFPLQPSGLFSKDHLPIRQTPPQSLESGQSPASRTSPFIKDIGVTSTIAETSSHSSTATVSSSNVSDKCIGNSRSFTCPHCNILYFDNALYVMHMGLHDPENPWQCNLCGDIYHDVYSFTSHFINEHRQ
ncbi:zinc finger protein Pegasus-like [Octopus vulgaris]|uniref:Zinc finger protein Pegasus-like n=1 Tax=Octopus vulgaris TaxID=6645 RepID=A0AA36AV53_OCTVU|nr:zinc finger protein Pegasus-like [Octopus vulgaris]